LIAIDGSEIMLPSNNETETSFGSFSSNIMNKSIVLARISKAYDVLNNISIDAKMVNRGICERKMAKEHIKHLNNQDLILLDRGYPAYELFRDILIEGIDFCARLTVASWRVAKELIKSGEKEVVENIIPSKEFLSNYKKHEIDFSPIPCRFICIKLPSGENEVLITSLLDKEKYPHGLFRKLYHLRWSVEESFKKDKHRLQLENFSGQSILAVMQDFYANLLLGNITSILTVNMDKVINERHKQSRKHLYQINIITALAKVKEYIAFLFSRNNIYQLIEKLMRLLIQNVLPIRPDRKFDRYKRRRRRYYKQYLPL
jgi:hypothetical protein